MRVKGREENSSIKLLGRGKRIKAEATTEEKARAAVLKCLDVLLIWVYIVKISSK